MTYIALKNFSHALSTLPNLEKLNFSIAELIFYFKYTKSLILKE